MLDEADGADVGDSPAVSGFSAALEDGLASSDLRHI
jgi:hypothetical protein